MLVEVINKGSVPYCDSNDNSSTGVSPENKLFLNVKKTKFMIFHNCQRVVSSNEIPDLIICETKIERVTMFNFSGTNNK